MVNLPDLAISFVAQEPKINQHYEAARRASEDWVIEQCDLDSKGRKIIEIGDFAYFDAVAAPCAVLSRYRISSDWVHGIFPFDDVFDVGKAQDNPEVAKGVLDNLVAAMQGFEIPDTKFAKAHQDICVRMKSVANKKTYNRFINIVSDYCTDVYNQVLSCSNGEVLPPDELIKMRRDTIGVRPLFVLVEFAQELNLLDEAMGHPLIQEIEALGVDWVLIKNDVLSYQQEEVELFASPCKKAKRLTIKNRKKASTTTWYRLGDYMVRERKKHSTTSAYDLTSCIIDSMRRSWNFQTFPRKSIWT